MNSTASIVLVSVVSSPPAPAALCRYSNVTVPRAASKRIMRRLPIATRCAYRAK